MQTIRNMIALIYSLALLSGGIYIGWQSNTFYSQVTQNPLSLLGKLGGK